MAGALERAEPDRSALLEHLRHVTRRWRELDEPCVLEVRCLAPNRTADARRFPATDAGLDAAAEHAMAMNRTGLNAYAVVNPIPADAAIAPGKAAEDRHIRASFFHWADADTPEAAERIRSHVGPRPTMTVLTGSVPFLRPHVYWELEEPTRNLDAWTRTQRGIAARLATDRAVVNPSRIMRLAGTITWPALSKQAKGYVSELVKLRAYDEDERPRVTSEAMAAAYPLAVVEDAPDEEGRRKNRADYADMIRRAQTDGEKHGGVRDMAASLAGQGVKRWYAEEMIRSVCPVWDENVEELIRSAYAKFYRPEREASAPEPMPADWEPGEPPAYLDEAPPRAPEERALQGGTFGLDGAGGPSVQVPMTAPFSFWEPVEPERIPPREWVYGRHYIRRFFGLTVAPGGLGKSTLVLSEGIAIATGRNILGVEPVERGPVLYFNAEDPGDEIKRRVAAVCLHHGIDQEELRHTFAMASGRDDPLIIAAGDPGQVVEATFELIERWAEQVRPAAIILDPLVNMITAQETNDTFARVGARLSRMADRIGCAVEIVHHTRKLGGREAEIEDSRGGSALIGAARTGRVLNPMTPDEAAEAGLKTHIDHFRVEGVGKANMSRPGETATWFRKAGVCLRNRAAGRREVDEDDWVAALEPWEWRDAFDGITTAQARACQQAVRDAAEPPRLSSQSKNWVGLLLGPLLGIDAEDSGERKRLGKIIKKWIATGVLEEVEVLDEKRMKRPAVGAGPTIPGGSA